MQRDLRQAQYTLTESVIRKFWRALSLSFPSLCVQDGMSIDYHQPFNLPKVERLADKLTRCHRAHVACPLFQYEYDPPNTTPHHVSAVTLTQVPGQGQILALFDPKGTGSVRKREEALLMNILAECLRRRTHRPTSVRLYQGKNLQAHDDIGLCQMFSLFYLYEYVTEVNRLSGSVVSDPNKMAPYIERKRGGFDEKTLHAFWQAYFQALHGQPRKKHTSQ